ncbi:MAG: hypothetical protein HeimC2_10380 [Candidatus Heimdallarchaeota archaeon LC_2]|nr:MAG: hypothetical protein HeimC2_10380 [Candidatus Heimdallarchaeota archaeon LC_2]
MTGIFFGKMKMKIQHYLCRIKCDGNKGVMTSWDETLNFVSNDQQIEKSIRYEKIKKVDDLDQYKKLGNFLLYLTTPLVALIIIYEENVGLSKLHFMMGFYISIAIAFAGVYLSMRSGMIIHHFDNSNNLISTRFGGYKKDIHLLMKVILGKIKKIVEKNVEKMSVS